MAITQTMKVINRLGLHLRAASQLVKASSKFKCRILIRHGGGHLDVKSLINLMTLAAGYGRELTFVFEGDDAEAAQEAIQRLFQEKFGEKE